MSKKIAMVTGAGGFIGGHLVGRLCSQGIRVIAVDIKPLNKWHQVFDACVTNIPKCDLRNQGEVIRAFNAAGQFTEVEEVYNLAADMGGMGFIENNKAACMLSVLISTNVLLESQARGVDRYFYSSSACVYAADKQTDTDVTALKEADAYPAMAEDGYGWEKLFSERMCRHFAEDYGMVTRVARFHNVYGPHGTYDGGREKAPAAICRKVIEAKKSGNSEIEIWGDGEQTRSFMYIDDCIDGIQRIMASNIEYPINLGSSELVSINELVTIVEDTAGVELNRTYKFDAPKGVRGRNSDNTLILEELDWEPSTPLAVGMGLTYDWINQEMTNS